MTVTEIIIMSLVGMGFFFFFTVNYMVLSLERGGCCDKTMVISLQCSSFTN